MSHSKISHLRRLAFHRKHAFNSTKMTHSWSDFFVKRFGIYEFSKMNISKYRLIHGRSDVFLFPRLGVWINFWSIDPWWMEVKGRTAVKPFLFAFMTKSVGIKNDAFITRKWTKSNFKLSKIISASPRIRDLRELFMAQGTAQTGERFDPK